MILKSNFKVENYNHGLLIHKFIYSAKIIEYTFDLLYYVFRINFERDTFLCLKMLSFFCFV